MSQRVAVVGAGMVGLSTAWFLQEHGFHVTVLERDHVAAGSNTPVSKAVVIRLEPASAPDDLVSGSSWDE